MNELAIKFQNKMSDADNTSEEVRKVTTIEDMEKVNKLTLSSHTMLLSKDNNKR